MVNWLHVQLLTWSLSFLSTPSAYLFADSPRGSSVKIATVTLLPGGLNFDYIKEHNFPARFLRYAHLNRRYRRHDTSVSKAYQVDI